MFQSCFLDTLVNTCMCSLSPPSSGHITSVIFLTVLEHIQKSFTYYLFIYLFTIQGPINFIYILSMEKKWIWSCLCFLICPENNETKHWPDLYHDCFPICTFAYAKTIGIWGNFIIFTNPQEIFLYLIINVVSARYLTIALASGVTATSHTTTAISSALFFCCVFDAGADNKSRLPYTCTKVKMQT